MMQPTQVTNNTSVYAINNLIETIKDGECGFRAAAEDCNDSKLKELFLQFSMQRADFAMELQVFVERHGNRAEESGTVAGAIHRGWINLKSSVATRDSLAILEECERGEEHAVHVYEETLQSKELGSAEPIVRRQYEQVRRVCEQVRHLKQQFDLTSSENH